MRKTLKVLKYFAPKTRAEWACDIFGWAALIVLAVVGQHGLQPW